MCFLRQEAYSEEARLNAQMPLKPSKQKLLHWVAQYNERNWPGTLLNKGENASLGEVRKNVLDEEMFTYFLDF